MLLLLPLLQQEQLPIVQLQQPHLQPQRVMQQNLLPIIQIHQQTQIQRIRYKMSQYEEELQVQIIR